MRRLMITFRAGGCIDRRDLRMTLICIGRADRSVETGRKMGAEKRSSSGTVQNPRVSGTELVVSVV